MNHDLRLARFFDRTLGRVVPSRWMRRDWDRRARENAPHYIDCGHSGTDEAFWSSGAADLEKLILADVALDPSARALEIGCGMGRLLRPLSRRIARATGIDISPEMIARARAALADCPKAELRVTTGRFDGVPDASLDLVYSFIVFQHVPSRAAVHRYLREAARALKGHGVLRFQVDGRGGQAKRADTWEGVSFQRVALFRRLERLGFEVVDRWGDRTQYFWITARRRPEPGRPSTGAVSVRERVWNEAALERALADLGLDAKAAGRTVVSNESSLRELAEPFLEQNRDNDAAGFVRRAYEVVLGRPADPEGLSFYSGEVAGGKPRSYVVDCLLASPEARERFRVRKA